MFQRLACNRLQRRCCFLISKLRLEDSAPSASFARTQFWRCKLPCGDSGNPELSPGRRSEFTERPCIRTSGKLQLSPVFESPQFRHYTCKERAPQMLAAFSHLGDHQLLKSSCLQLRVQGAASRYLYCTPSECLTHRTHTQY